MTRFLHLILQRVKNLPSQLARLRRSKPVHLDLSAATASLRIGSQKLTTGFHSIGSDLQLIDDQSRELTTICETLLRLASGKTEGISLFQDSMKVLDQPMAHIDRSVKALEPLLALIQRCEQHSAELLKCQLTMGQVLAPLRHMIVLFKIEAAQLDPENQTTFFTVADEIHRLRELIDRTFDENVAQLEAARRTVANVHAKVQRDYTAQSTRIVEKRGEIDRAIEMLGSQLERESRRDNHLRESSSALRAAISRLVSALQFEDILTQRIDHLLSALHAGPPARAHHAWLQLIGGQVADVFDELESARQELETGVAEIINHAKGVDQAAMKLQGFDRSTASADGMVQLLLEAFHETSAIIEENSALALESLTLLKPVSEVSESLSSVVIEVSLNIQLIALNAQVRSVQLGDGSGLEVLAARTAEISFELASLGDRTSQEITELRETIQSLLGSLSEIHTAGEAHSTDLKTRGAHVITGLHQLRDHTLVTLQSVADQMKAVNALSDHQTLNLRNLTEAGQAITEAAQSIHDLQPDHPVSAQQIEHLRSLSKSYTMVAEHKVHAEITGQRHDVPVHDDSTEFFVDLPSAHAEGELAFAPAASASPGSNATRPDAPNVELF